MASDGQNASPVTAGHFEQRQNNSDSWFGKRVVSSFLQADTHAHQHPDLLLVQTGVAGTYLCVTVRKKTRVVGHGRTWERSGLLPALQDPWERSSCWWKTKTWMGSSYAKDEETLKRHVALGSCASVTQNQNWRAQQNWNWRAQQAWEWRTQQNWTGETDKTKNRTCLSLFPRHFLGEWWTNCRCLERGGTIARQIVGNH